LPLGTPALATAAVGNAATSVTTASFTPAEGDLLLAFTASRVAAAATPTISDSLGGTWTAVTGSPTDFNNIHASLYYQVVGASPAARTVTATSASATQIGLAVVSISGAGTDFSNFEIGTNGAGDPSVTMAAYNPSSLAMGFYAGNAGGSNPSSPTGFTNLVNTQIATNIRFQVSYDTSSPTTSLSWSGPSTDSIGMGLEVQEAAGGSEDNLTSQDISNAPTIEEPTIGQTNGLTALGLTSSPSVEEPALSQEQAITTLNLSTSPTIQSPTLSQTHNLTSLSISNSPFITQPNIEDTGDPNYILLRNAIRLMRRKAVRVIFLDEMWDDDNPEEL
jgi:hypothetical protein